MSAGPWKRTVVGDPATERATITYERGGWRIVKSFYADGASMFSYRVYGPTGICHTEERTLTRAKRYVDRAIVSEGGER